MLEAHTKNPFGLTVRQAQDGVRKTGRSIVQAFLRYLGTTRRSKGRAVGRIKLARGRKEGSEAGFGANKFKIQALTSTLVTPAFCVIGARSTTGLSSSPSQPRLDLEFAGLQGFEETAWSLYFVAPKIAG